ncbi:carbohydrate ABC transporter substrate-binding protein (CUT1 family) [Nonomuraea polychroma]|uniref:Carbohydrate ABC transporter substrate-binding protein (CUT1 family) n=1 Tax=Nonomuraea polychroma TaxID=46176 RepID=A0A438LZ54_9ACTN|nr:sugar ABC transporter substrate-binding protein [Nonomuraea polychroma]RVX38819.1 carbohydrate ABC transporter substrate-binding protein (CUT1 family) [Nonomuraea polychroma]
MRRILASCIAMVTLAACAPGTTSGGGNEQVDDKTLTYLYFTDGPDEQATRNLIADYEKKSGVKVDLQIVPFDNLEQRLQARLSGGNAPDVARLTDISPFRSDLLDLNKFQKAALDGQFIDGAKAYITGAGGELLAVPSDLTMNGPLVNVDQFKKAGVSLPDVTKPWKWDEMVAAAQKVQKANKTQYAIAMDVSGHRFSTMLSQFGTTFFSADGTSVGLDTQKATAAVKLFADLNASGVLPADLWLQAGSKYKAANEIFLAQQTPVYISGNWQVSAFAKDATFTWAAAPNPCQETCGGFPGGKFMASFKQSKRQQAAADFIAYMNSKESQERLAKEANFLPTRKDLISSGIDYPQRDADMKVFLADVSRTPPQAFATSYSPAFAATAKATVDALGKVLAKSQSPEQAVETIKAAAEKALKDTK